MRSEILKLRNDPTANAVMAGAFTRANAAILTARLGRPPSEGELYMAHFLGAGGAARLITLAASSPGASAAYFFGHAAHANASIFYDRATGAARSLAQVRNVLTARYDVARSNQGPPSGAAQMASEPAAPPAAAPAAIAVPDTAGINDAFAAAAPPVPPMPVPDNTAAGAAAAGSGNAAVAIAGAGGPAAAVAGTGIAAPPAVVASNTTAAAAPPKRVAEDRQIFHGLFQDSNGPLVASLVSELWTSPALASGATPPAGQSSAVSLRDLFKDPAQGS